MTRPKWCIVQLKLPNAENVVLPESKFTKYLFAGDYAEGLAKGKAISSRLGYDINNWKAFSNVIKESAAKYPVIIKANDQYGTKYEQKIVVYGFKEMPANVIVGWIHRPNGEVSMTSTYIKEVKI